MLQEMIFLASSSIFPSGIVGELLAKWEEAGFFNYLIPFLIIFALVFGVLSKLDPFKENKAIYAIIAASTGLMALRFEMVPLFFAEIFPRLGIGLAVILGILVIAGLFIDTGNNAINYVLLGVGVIIVGMVIIQSTEAVGWQSGQWWSNNWQMIIGVILLFILIAVVIGNSSTKNKTPTTYVPVYAKK